MTYLFSYPTSLPPFCQNFHSISLFPNSKPPNIRPYRHPYHKKSEIEKQDSKLLQTGFIQLSTSPFGSSILLVKKKDSSWHMRIIDYRGLDQITIPDKYPIPKIEELFDELHGATILSMPC